MRSYLWSVFSCIRTKYVPEITPYLDTFHEPYFNDDNSGGGVGGDHSVEMGGLTEMGGFT